MYDFFTGVWTDIHAHNAATGYSTASAVNNAGQVCGYRSLDDGGSPITPFSAYVYQAGTFTDLGLYRGLSTNAYGISEEGAVVGGYNVTNQERAFVWSNGAFEPLPTLANMATAGMAVDVAGTVAGRSLISLNPGAATRAVLWRDGEILNLGTLPGDSRSMALAINNAGVVIGTSWLSAICRVFVWQDHSMRDLNALHGNPSIQAQNAGDISESGLIVLTGEIDEDMRAIVFRPVVIAGDATSDCVVNVSDLLAVITGWGACVPAQPCAGDLDGSGQVNVSDLLSIIGNWGNHAG